MSKIWRHKIKIKEYFQDETTPELISLLSTNLKLQIERIKNREISIHSNLDEEEKEPIIDDLDILIDNFDFLNNLATGKIPKNSWSNYSFDGNFKDLFNDYLSQLYDLGDTVVLIKTGGLEKFIWIE